MVVYTAFVTTRIKSHHVLHHITAEHFKASLSPNLWTLFEKAFPLVFILNRAGQEATVLRDYYCFLDEEHLAGSILQLPQAIPTKPGWVCGWSHRRLLLPFYPSQQAKRKYFPVTRGRKGVLVWFWFAVLFKVTGHQRRTARLGTGSSPFHVVQGSSNIFVSQSSSWEQDYLKYQQLTLTAALKKPRNMFSFVPILLVFLHRPHLYESRGTAREHTGQGFLAEGHWIAKTAAGWSC